MAQQEVETKEVVLDELRDRARRLAAHIGSLSKEIDSDSWNIVLESRLKEVQKLVAQALGHIYSDEYQVVSNDGCEIFLRNRDNEKSILSITPAADGFSVMATSGSFTKATGETQQSGFFFTGRD